MGTWSDAGEDILGYPYEVVTLPLGSDSEGLVRAVLVRRMASRYTGRAVLCLPGYNDYFFQRHSADFYATRGINFYALDFRKYGRACQSHETRHLCRSLEEYFPEIDMAVNIIRTVDGNERLLLSGHSTGGLVGALWLDQASGKSTADALFLNSPFLSTGVPPTVQAALNPVLHFIGKRWPRAAFPGHLSPRYSRSLHVNHNGEWEFNEEWKSTSGTPLRLGWLAAVHEGQRRVRAGLGIRVPILVMCSTRSSGRRATPEELHHSDSVLDVSTIARLSGRLGGNVSCVHVEDAMHDVLLSCPGARERAFEVLDRWMSVHV